jgi:TolB-like protein/Flp pilus assembly protein TadD
MVDGLQPRPLPPDPSSDRLDSWKEIAVYLKKEVRTVQRWEKKFGLPVRRMAQGKQSTVFAYRSEIDKWWKESESKISSEKDRPEAEDDPSESNSSGAVPKTVVPNPTDIEETTVPDGQGNSVRYVALGVLTAALVVTALLLLSRHRIHDAFWPPPTRIILAVRPFKNISGDPAQDFIADGLTEEMITRLGQLHPHEMGVIRLSSVYASSGLDRIGKDIHANYVVEGSVLRSGSRVAITAHLIQVIDQTQKWGQIYDRELDDVLRIQAEVAGAIAQEVLDELPLVQPPVRQVNGDAYLAYLEGRYFWNKRTEEGFAQAIKLFQKSIEIDPTYAPPYAGLADCYELLGSAPYSTLKPEEAFPKSEAAARKALELDPTLAEAHVPLGYSQLVYERNFPEAQKEFERALQLRPEYATGHQFYGYYLTAVGRLDDAIVERKKSLSLDPISPLLHSALGEAYYHARQFKITIQQNKQALELDPTYAIALVNIGRAYEQLGMHPEARAAFQRILAAAPNDPAILALMGHEYGVSGDKADANKLLTRLTTVATRQYVPAIYFAVVYIGLNQKDDAFLWLEKAYQERCEYLVYLGSEPLADPLRGDPRFSKLLARIGIKPVAISATLRSH